MSPSDVASDATSVVLVLMFLGLLGAGWLWLMAVILRSARRIIRGGPNYARIARLERREDEARRRAERVH